MTKTATKTSSKPQTEVSTYKGNKVLTINQGKPFAFGLGKAKKFLDNIEAVQAFVDKYDQPQE